jgi:hypothetical protein
MVKLCLCLINEWMNYLITTPWRYIWHWKYRSIILDHGTIWRWVVSIMSRPLYPWEWRWDGHWVDGVKITLNWCEILWQLLAKPHCQWNMMKDALGSRFILLRICYVRVWNYVCLVRHLFEWRWSHQKSCRVLKHVTSFIIVNWLFSANSIWGL